jgi:uncharacterized protein (DUF983 family)
MAIVVVGHIVGTLLLVTEEAGCAAMAAHCAMANPGAQPISLDFAIMKGGLVAHQWALRMHGFEAAQRPGSAIGKSDSK